MSALAAHVRQVHIVQQFYKTGVTPDEATWLDTLMGVQEEHSSDFEEEEESGNPLQEPAVDESPKASVIIEVEEDDDGDGEEDEEEEEEDEDDDAEAVDGLLVEPMDIDGDCLEDAAAAHARAVQLSAARQPKKTRGQNTRKAYSTKKKHDALVYMEKVELELRQSREEGRPMPTYQDIAHHCALRLHVVEGTLVKWLVVGERQKIRTDFARFYRKRGTGGAAHSRTSRNAPLGRRPLFPLSERVIGDLVRARRAEHLAMSRAWVALQFQHEAHREMQLLASRGGPAALVSRMEACKFSKKMINGFFRREHLALRRVTCIKTIPLDEAVRILRGFYTHWFHQLLLDPERYASSPLDLSYGRYILACRLNKDQVPVNLGGGSKTVSLQAERATHVRHIAGYGGRIATLILTINGDGHLLDMVLIFKGAGAKQESYNVPGIHVFYQRKAWIDEPNELRYWRTIMKPYVDNLGAGAQKPECVMLHDSVSAHTCASVKEYAKGHCNTLCLNPPPNTTHYWQTIDCNVGRLVRQTMYDYLEEWMASELAAGRTKPTAPQKRAAVVEGATRALEKWRTPACQRTLRGACDATLLSLPVTGYVPLERTSAGVDALQLAKVPFVARPVRFPLDFVESIVDKEHPKHEDATPFDPFAAISRRGRQRVAAPADAPVDVEDHDLEDVDDDNDDEALDLGFLSDEEDEYVECDDSCEAIGMAAAELNQSLGRCCLAGCVCEDPNANRAGRCLCKGKFGGVCLESCRCHDCQLGLKKALSVWEAEIAQKHQLDVEVHADTAVRLSEGDELLVVAVIAHEIDDDDDGVQFQVEWADGDTTWQRLETMVDLADDNSAIVNSCVEAYAAALGLNIKHYLKVLVEEQDSDPDGRAQKVQKRRRRITHDDREWRGVK